MVGAISFKYHDMVIILITPDALIVKVLVSDFTKLITEDFNKIATWFVNGNNVFSYIEEEVTKEGTALDKLARKLFDSNLVFTSST